MIGLRPVAVRVALVGLGTAALAVAVLVVADRGFGADEQLVVALGVGALAWCAWWAWTIREQLRLPQAIGVGSVLAGLLVGEGIAADEHGPALAAATATVIATSSAVVRVGGERARLRNQIGEVAVEVAGARAAAAAANESEVSRLGELDRLVHGLSSIELHARVAARTSAGEARASFEQIERTAADHLAEARRHEPVATSDTSAGATNSTTLALHRVVERFVRNVDVNGGLEVRGEPKKVPATVELALIRTLQEAVSNIRRHARAGSFRAVVTFGSDAVELDVTDDGIGFDPAGVGDDSGLATARKRIEVLGGTLSIERGAAAGGAAEVGTDTGTRLSASVPLAPDGA